MQAADPFIFRPPTPATKPRYERLHEAERACWTRLLRVVHPFTDYNAMCVGAIPMPEHKDFTEVNAATKEFYDIICEVAPATADRAAAEMSVRLARMLCNEAMVCPSGGADAPLKNFHAAQIEVRKARMLACAAIALADEADLPPLTTPAA